MSDKRKPSLILPVALTLTGADLMTPRHHLFRQTMGYVAVMRSPVSSIVLGFVLFLAPLRLYAAEKPVTKERIDVLVEQMASPNSAPTRRGSGVRYAPDYDKHAQKKVRDAFFELRSLGPPAFPHLFDHFDDKRYALTADGGAALDNWTVGDLCYDAIDCQLQPYKTGAAGAADSRTIPPRPYYPGHIKLRDPKEAKVWWATHQNKSLRELQIEGLEWVIAEESKTPEKYENAERQKLAELLKTLKSSDEPLPLAVPWAR